MNIVICDGDRNTHETIETYIKQCGRGFLDEQNCQISYFESGEDLLEYYNNGNHADVLFLETKIGADNGIEIGRSVRSMDEDVITIFVSDDTQKVFDALDCIIFNFLPKPILYDAFCEVFRRALDLYNRNHPYYYIKAPGTITQLDISDIIYVESYCRHVKIHTVNGEYEETRPIKDISSKLAPYGFIRTHQGYIVNMQYITEVSKTDVVLTNGVRTLLSTRRHSEVMTAYKDYIDRMGYN